MAAIAEVLTRALQRHQAGNLREAEQLYQQILHADPHHADAHHLLGVLAHQAGRHEDAIASILRALAINSTVAAYYSNLGVAYYALGQYGHAVKCYRHALQLNPNSAESHNNLGNALKQQQQFQEAIGCYQRALQLNPNYAVAYNNLATAMSRLGKLLEALTYWQYALRLQPDLAEARSNLLSGLHYDPGMDADAIFAAHQSWGQQLEAMTPVLPHANDPNPDRRLRVGYLSPDFRNHATARYLEPVLANHDPNQIEVFCYAEVASPDATTARLQKLVHGWRSTLRKSDAEVVRQIRDDRIDILVDLAGHTDGNRLEVLAHKPAPVQATWLGYMNTTGLTRVDYRLTDDVLDPAGQPVRDTEQLWRLPGGFCTFGPQADAPPVSPLPALQRGCITFGSLNSLLKINPQVIELWSRVLKAVPRSRLLMFRDTISASMQEHLRGQFAQHGISGEKLDLRTGSGEPGFLEIYREIDICLDTFPCTGGVTTCEALWMGVPVMTLCGVRPVGRNSAAILTRIGLTEWIAADAEQFVESAALWSNRLQALAELRSGLQKRMAATLGDAGQFTRGLEAAFRAMWRNWCKMHPG